MNWRRSKPTSTLDAEDAATLTPAKPDIDKLRSLYAEFELRRLLESLEDDADEPAAGATGAPNSAGYETITTKKALQAWLKKLRQASELAGFDTETTSVNYMEAELVGLSFAVGPARPPICRSRMTMPGAPKQLDRDEVLAAMKPWLEDPGASSKSAIT